MADLRAFSRLLFEEKLLDEVELPNPSPLWRLHRKEPGCVVGEHMQVRLGVLCFLTTCWWRLREGLTVEIERFGDTAFKRTDEADDGVEFPYMLIRVGDADLVKKVDEREVKLELEEAKAVEEAETDGDLEKCWWNLPDGDTERITEPLEVLLEDPVAMAAIVVVVVVLFLRVCSRERR
ncbi:hypothetical protein DKX38_028500 [Salix brachista]|uniref:Uncharacterized protein n=1 Tax=Salix brachista TaxID=2182728 RepID=A0A5N5J9F2_9ROSI|nr:hypothetical protein DKX38_028500 [Salix brachista]